LRAAVFRAPTPIYATHHSVGGAITAAFAVLLPWLWRIANDRGDDDRDTIW
jgi:hypothetical protein